MSDGPYCACVDDEGKPVQRMIETWPGRWECLQCGMSALTAAHLADQEDTNV